MRAIMYHYVRTFDKKFPHLPFLDIKQFQKQLDFFSNKYKFVTREEWYEFINSGNVPPEKGKIILTFDDNFSDHYHYVYNELRKRKLWGIFYTSTGPYTDKKFLDVHKVQLLCASINGVKLIKELKKLINPDDIDLSNEDLIKNSYNNQINREGISEFKRILNYLIDYRIRSEIIEKLCEIFDLIFDTKSFYMTEKNIIEMKSEGMIIGSQAKNHFLMNRINKEQQISEIQESFDYLNSICSLDHLTYCHPFGGSHSYNNETLQILESLNVQYSFSVEDRQISNHDLKYNKQCLPRFDCNQFRHGKSEPKK